MNNLVSATFQDLNIPDFVEQADHLSLMREIMDPSQPVEIQNNPERLPRLGLVFERLGIDAYEQWIRTGREADHSLARKYFDDAFSCWRTIHSLTANSTSLYSWVDGVPSGEQLIEEELPGEPLDAKLTLAFRMGSCGIAAQRVSEARLELATFNLDASDSASQWRDRVASQVFSAVVLLIRKANGWTDVTLALSRVEDLRQLQAEFEDAYLSERETTAGRQLAAVELVGLYHLAQMTTLVGDYLRSGEEPQTRVNLGLDRHRDRALKSFHGASLPLLESLTDLLWVCCRELVQNSIWTHVRNLGEASRGFARSLSDHGRPNPVIELWPSQQDALRGSLLDPYRRAVIVEMPTSAGKTLLAKFTIIQTKALNPDGITAYVVPTRALVNQVTRELRRDFRGLNPSLTVEQAVPAYELDPTEQRLLEHKIDVLVTTPEKLDLLIRQDHVAVQRLALVVADEAHNISDSNRGPRLELLLGTIKRERGEARFLLLSPFLPNDDDLVRWLGEDRAAPPIRVNWRPARKLVGSVTTEGRRPRRKLVFEAVDATDNADVPAGSTVVIASGESVPPKRTISGISSATVGALSSRGCVLVLTRGRGTANRRARELAAKRNYPPAAPLREVVCRYLETELGPESSLVATLRKGVAYHHAGLSHEARWLIEALISQGQVDVVCGTTTLAQGMNFPISSVVVETLRKGDEELSFHDFWNIAGRAGRALVDTVGVIAFPVEDDTKRSEVQRFLRREAGQITSQLTALLVRADEIAGRFDMTSLRALPELSPLLQFLAHAMRVSGSDSVADEVEDILRSSLVYHQVQEPVQMQRLIDLCRSYLLHIRGARGLVTLADKTGFATPSVLQLLRDTSKSPEFTNAKNWAPERLFGDDIGPLRQRVEVIADLPEMQLGATTATNPFNPERIAKILRDWVRGEPLAVLASRYGSNTASADPDRATGDFSNYLFSTLLSKASWGIGALEGVAFAGQEDVNEDEVGHVPTMIYFGVRRKEAVWLRMAGVPRIAADGLADIWRSHNASEPGTYDDIRDWVGSLSDAEWQRGIPANSALSPSDMRTLWNEFAG